ncbi:MAG: hypothetical protein ACLPI9_08815 [Halobacteriota archaeon]|jgi:hypothetical protein
MIAPPHYRSDQLNAYAALPGFHPDLSVSVLEISCMRHKKLERFQIASFGQRGMIRAIERCSKDYYAFIPDYFVSNVQAR